MTTYSSYTTNKAPTFTLPLPNRTGSIELYFGSNWNDTFAGLTVLRDGKMVVAGYTEVDFNDGSYHRISLVRLNANGTFDTSFSGDGQAVLDLDDHGGWVDDVIQQSDGKLLVGCTSYNNGKTQFNLLRLNADGTSDQSFGMGGRTSFDIANTWPSDYTVKLQPDGKITVTAVGQNGFSLMRFTANGTLDTSFNTAWQSLFTSANNYYGSSAYSVTAQPDGKWLVAGTNYDAITKTDLAVARLNADGTLDTSFSDDGKAFIDISGTWDELGSFTLQPNGKILLVSPSGWSAGSLTSLVRLNADGTLDSSFSDDGMAQVNLGDSGRWGQSVALQPDGKILLLGSSWGTYTMYRDFSVARVNADGTLDRSFGMGGVATYDINYSFDSAYTIQVQSDGKIVVAGDIEDDWGDYSHAGIMRLNIDGSLDTSFGHEANRSDWSGNTLGDTAEYTEGEGPVVLDADAAVYDVELAALGNGIGNYGGASLTLARTGGASAQDVFSALGGLAFSNGSVLLHGFAVGTVNNRAGQLSMTFNANATQMRVNEVLRSIGYSNTSDAPPENLELTWTFRDGSGAAARSVTGTSMVHVLNEDDPLTGSLSIQGTPMQGQRLNAVSTLADADGIVQTYWQWQRDGRDIAGAEGSSYRLTQADAGHRIAVSAFLVDQYGGYDNRTSTAVTVTNVNDAPTGYVTVTGSMVERQTVTVVSTLADADGMGPVSYQWLRGAQPVSGATGTRYTLTQADVGKAISVRANYSDGFGTPESVASYGFRVANMNDAPTGSVMLSGTPTQGQTLTAAHTLDDADGMGTVGWQWLRDGRAIVRATGASYTLSQADVGKAISVAAVYVDQCNTREVVTSSATQPVANVNDAPTGVVETFASTGHAVSHASQGEWLSLRQTLSDADGLGPLSIQWLRDGTAVTGSTLMSYRLAQIDVGHAISVRVSYTDGAGAHESVTSAAVTVANVNDAPTGNVVVSGFLRQGQVLTASHTLADADGLGVVHWQWLRGGVAVESAVGANYTLTQADVGQGISVRASYTDGGGTAESKDSRVYSPVANVNDAATGNVILSGTAEVGQTLTAAYSLSDLDGMGVVTLQWLRGGAAIAGATGTSYALTAADVGKSISVRASFTDLLGGKEAVTSAATATVIHPADTLTGDASGVAMADLLRGGAGDSLINGLGGNDRLYGEAGNDTLLGGAGSDTLTGGAGNDVFRFTTLGDLGMGATRDVITDFTRGQDRIDLSLIDADPVTADDQAFSFVINNFGTAPGQIRYVKANGIGIVSINTDTDTAAEYEIQLIGSVPASLTAADFVL